MKSKKNAEQLDQSEEITEVAGAEAGELTSADLVEERVGAEAHAEFNSETAEQGEMFDESEATDLALADLEGYESLPEEEREYEETSGLLTPKDRAVLGMRLEAKVEAIVFASQKPLKPQEILDILNDSSVSEDHVQETLDQLCEFYEQRAGGFRLQYLKRLGYQFQTAQSAGAIMERMFASRPRPISRAALETLAIIAYRQPVTRAEVEFIRGVDAGSIFKTLLERELIKCVGRKEMIGRPMLFGTTDNFLTVFNLSSIKDLPPLEAFQPSREMVSGAMERLEDGAEGEVVDVEEYIADHTRGEDLEIVETPEPEVSDEVL